jgi:hypothetical protein
MARPISIAVRGGTCFTEQESSDEPYVITSVVDLTNRLSFAGETLTTPAVNTTRTGPWSGVDTGETFRTRGLLPGTTVANFNTNLLGAGAEVLGNVMRKPVWGFDWQPKLVPNPDHIIILCGLFEHDDTGVEALRGIVQSYVVAEANAVVNVTPPLDRETIVARLIEQFNSACATLTGVPMTNSDERIGQIQELRLTPDIITQLDTASHRDIKKTLKFKGAFDADGHDLDPNVKYNVTYQIRNYSFIG